MSKQELPALLFAFVSQACQTGSPGHPVPAHYPLQYVDTVPLATKQQIWEGALRFYAARQTGGEAQILVQVQRTFGSDTEQSNVEPSQYVLLGKRAGLKPYDGQWLRSLPLRGLVRAVCPETQVERCPDSTVTNYLDLGDPVALATDTVDLPVMELAVNPRDCRVTSGKGGDSARWWLLAIEEGRWKVIAESTRITISDSWSCGKTR